MALDQKNLNSVYALAKDKKTGKWQLGQWANQGLWSVDGSNRKICAYKDMTLWRFFRESQVHFSDVKLKQGDRVNVENKRGNAEWYYVIDSISSDDGKLQYLIGI